MAQPVDWLGQFIEQEIRAVIAWKQAASTNPQVKPDQDDRFSDDGSNFRSVVVSPMLPTDCKVQIAEILPLQDPVTLFVTDGFTRAKAKLSGSALASLEAGLGEKLECDLKGDVVMIREMTIESTPYGPDDGLIQLAIGNLDYLYHLRKPLGQPILIKDRNEAQRLLEEITNLRIKQYHSSTTSSPAVIRAGASHVDENNTPKSQRSIDPSQVSSPAVNYSPSTQRPLATQIPTRRKPSGPTLAKDGYEMSEGVNLSRPMAAGVRDTNASVQNEPVAPNDSSAKLLRLLGKRKAESPAKADGAARAVSPPPARSTRHEPAVAPDVDSRAVLPRQNASETEQPTPSKQRRLEHRRHRIPRTQQKLLEKSSSWIPSLPGQRYPHPNVPIELLRQWNDQAERNAQLEAKSAGSSPSHLPEADVKTSVVNQEPKKGNDVYVGSASSSSSESSSDEEIPASQWPSSPTQRKPQLPPDSSAAHNSRPSTAGNPEVISSDNSDGLDSGSPAAQQRRQERPPNSSAT